MVDHHHFVSVHYAKYPHGRIPVFFEHLLQNNPQPTVFKLVWRNDELHQNVRMESFLGSEWFEVPGSPTGDVMGRYMQVIRVLS